MLASAAPPAGRPLTAARPLTATRARAWGAYALQEESRKALELEQARREELSQAFNEAMAELRAKFVESEAKLKRTPEHDVYGDAVTWAMQLEGGCCNGWASHRARQRQPALCRGTRSCSAHGPLLAPTLQPSCATRDPSVRQQLKSLMEQYELREKHFAAILKVKDIETRLSEARLQQQTEIAASEAQRVSDVGATAAAGARTRATHAMHTRHGGKGRLDSSQTVTARQHADVATQREAEVRQQLETYADKFEQIQEAINKSTVVFGAFKREMDTVRAHAVVGGASRGGGAVPTTTNVCERASARGARGCGCGCGCGLTVFQMTKKLRRMERDNDALQGRCDSMSQQITDLKAEVRAPAKKTDCRPHVARGRHGLHGSPVHGRTARHATALSRRTYTPAGPFAQNRRRPAIAKDQA